MPWPAALPALCLLAGIIAGVILGSPWIWPAAVLAAGAWAAAIVLFRRERAGAVAGALAASFCAAGVTLGADAAARATGTPLRRLFEEGLLQPAEPTILEGTLREDARPTRYGASLLLDVDHVAGDPWTGATSGGVRLSVGGTLVGEHRHEWRAGRRIRTPASLRRPSRYLNAGVADGDLALARRGVALLGSVKSGALVEVLASGSRLAEAAATSRQAVRDAIGAGVGRWSDRSAGIIVAILIGDRAGLEDEVNLRLQKAGTFHVIAISGGNIAILAGLLLASLRLLGVAPRPASAAVMIALVFYAYVVVDEASVTRATLVAVVYLAARLWDHRVPPLNTLAVAGAAILTASPLAIFDAGFLLSFGATLGILIGASALIATLRALAAERAGLPLPSWTTVPLGLLAATICAEVALFPVAAFIFSRVTFAGLVLNFAAIPLMTVAQAAGLAVLALAAIHSAPAAAAGYVAHVSAYWLVESARPVDLAPWVTFRVPAPAPALLVAYYAGWIAHLGLPGRPAVRRVALTGSALAAIAMLSAPLGTAGPIASWVRWGATRDSGGLLRAPPGNWLQVMFLDVGQADATLIRLPDGRHLLVDAAGDPLGAFDVGGRVVAPALWRQGVRRLEFLALTHGDPDHVGGAPAVLRDFRPREIWEGVPVPRDERLQAIAAEARGRRIIWRSLQAGHRLELAGVEIELWHPPLPDWERQKVRNDDSLVIELRYGDVSVVLPGDIGREVERSLAGRLPPAALRILKVAHHGSASSTTAEFLASTRPDAAVISAGRGNWFGHPAPAVLERLQAAGAAVFRTDQDGAVMVTTDGAAVWVATWTGRTLVLR